MAEREGKRVRERSEKREEMRERESTLFKPRRGRSKVQSQSGDKVLVWRGFCLNELGFWRVGFN